jgi:aspartyl-tRNA(Asn)/glutamyl-tRNA(Gln) amidotransferase subunit A
MAWRVPDLAASLDVVIGPDPTDLRSLPMPEASWRRAVDNPSVPIRLAWSPTLGYATVDREVLELCQRAVGLLADLGAEVIEQEVVFDEDPVTPWVKLVGGYLQRTFAGVRHTDAWQEVTPGLRAQVEGSEGLTVVDFVRAADAAHLLNLRLVELFAHSRVLITPTVAGQTPLCGGHGTVDGAEVLNWIGFTYPFNLTASPAGTVCVGLTRAGLPVGLQLIGPQHGDVGVLRAMAALEAAIGFDERPDTRVLRD